MAMSQEELKTLALELAAGLPPIPPQPVEIVAVTGEAFTVEALEVARIVDRLSATNRDALLTITRSMAQINRAKSA